MHRLAHPEQDRPHNLGAADALQQLVGDVGRFQAREDQHIRIRDLAEVNAKASGITAAAYAANLAKDIPLRRLARPEEIADAIVWLASERASYITGQTILVDGGAYRGL